MTLAELIEHQHFRLHNLYGEVLGGEVNILKKTPTLYEKKEEKKGKQIKTCDCSWPYGGKKKGMKTKTVTKIKNALMTIV